MTPRRPRRMDLATIDPVTWSYLNDAELPEGSTAADFMKKVDDVMRGMAGLPPIAAVWREHRDAILASWIAERPGTRPAQWWRFDAPAWPPDEQPARWRNAYFSSALRAPRLRVGGVGTATHDALNYRPEYDHGIPELWLTAEDVALYAALGPFPYDALNPFDPPAFEAQAAYLQRHGLLTPDEERRQAFGEIDLNPELVDDVSTLET